MVARRRSVSNGHRRFLYATIVYGDTRAVFGLGSRQRANLHNSVGNGNDFSAGHIGHERSERNQWHRHSARSDRDRSRGFEPISYPDLQRERLVELTREGTRLFEKAAPLWNEAQRHMERLNGKERVDTLRTELAELVMDGA